jgi:hypothetical protein
VWSHEQNKIDICFTDFLFDASALTLTRVASDKTLENSSLAGVPSTSAATALLVIHAYYSV